MNEYLVTGGLGFIGSHLVKELMKDENNRVWIIDDGSNACWNPRKGRLDYDTYSRDLLVQLMAGYEVTDDPRNPRLVCISGDCAHSNILDLIRHARFSCVFHLAGSCSVMGSIQEPLDYLEQNLFKTLKIAKACAEGHTRLIFSSSAAVYGTRGFTEEDDALLRPTNPYGATKYSAENWLRMYRDLYQLDFVSLRYFNAYGPRQRAGSPYSGVIANWVHNIWMSKPCIVYGDGTQTRDFVHVADIARANIKAINVPTTGFHTYNICSERRSSLNGVLSILQEITRHSFAIKYEDAREEEVKHSTGNNTRALVSLEWEPAIGLYEGLHHFLQWRGVECKIE